MRAVLFFLAALAMAKPVSATTTAVPVELRGLVSSATPKGCDDYRVLFWNLYRAELWTDAVHPPGDTYGLSLTYRSEFSLTELVETSVEEMSRISGRPKAAFENAAREMERAFRSVVPGDRITVWRDTDDVLRVFANGRETGVISGHTDTFLAIWLGAETRFPKAREALLQGRCDD